MTQKTLIPIIVGRGKLATEVINYFKEIDQVYNEWNEQPYSTSCKSIQYIIIYASNADKFEDVFKFAQEFKIPLINGCTDISFGKSEFKDETDFFDSPNLEYHFNPESVIIDAPNWDLSIVGWMAAIKKYGKLIAYNAKDIVLEESHQSSKKSVPGTARVFANGLGLNESEIYSERDPANQKLHFNIPDKRLGGHAVHRVYISYQNSEKEIGFHTRVMGRKDYAIGVLNIAKEVIENQDKLQAGVYTIEEMVDLGLFQN
jgi:dihydrodipicolinate reductase